MEDSIPRARLVFRYGKSSLWFQDNTRFVVLTGNGHVDYPLKSGNRVLYDFPERIPQRMREKVTRYILKDQFTNPLH